MAGTNVPRRCDAEMLARLLDSPEVARLVAQLEATRWTGRPGYPTRAMVGMVLVKSLYVLPTWSRTAALVAEHAALRAALGGEAPSVYACYRFTAKLRQHKASLDACIAAVLASLHDEMPELGRDIAIDGSDLPAYANGQRFVYNHGPERKRFSDPDASWDHRSSISVRKGGGYYGYKVHAAVCATVPLVPVKNTPYQPLDIAVAREPEAGPNERRIEGRSRGVASCRAPRKYLARGKCRTRAARPAPLGSSSGGPTTTVSY